MDSAVSCSRLGPVKSAMNRLTTVLISNIPAPYREPVYETVANELPDAFTVLYCNELEKDRQWKFPPGKYPKVFLAGKSFSAQGVHLHHIHWNSEVWRQLNRLDPALVITNGYSPTHLAAFLWARVHRRPHAAMTDGWRQSEASLSEVHRWVRRVVLKRSVAFIGASFRSLELFQDYGASPDQCFQSHLCCNNDAFLRQDRAFADRPFDLMFSAQFIDLKMPDFFCEVARLIKLKRGAARVLMLGDGPLRHSIMQKLTEFGIAHDCPGYMSQESLPAYYARAKMLLFPTRQECWGVVVNEACAAGTPVMTCGNTAVDGELVVDGVNGHVLPLDPKLWAEAALALLEDAPRWTQFSQASREMVSAYTYTKAAHGLVDAVHSVLGN
jgi:glycosyltransferase involved in cell wall biosynthesis